MERYVRRRTKLLRNMVLWRREAPQEVREFVTRLVGEVLRPALGRNWGGGGQEMAAMASFPDLSCTILTIAKVRGVAGTALPPDLVTFLERGLTRGW